MVYGTVYRTLYINIRILQTLASGLANVLGLRTRMSDPYVYVVVGGVLKVRLPLNRSQRTPRMQASMITDVIFRYI